VLYISLTKFWAILCFFFVVFVVSQVFFLVFANWWISMIRESMIDDTIGYGSIEDGSPRVQNCLTINFVDDREVRGLLREIGLLKF